MLAISDSGLKHSALIWQMDKRKEDEHFNEQLNGA